MRTSSSFTVAIHILAYLAFDEGQIASSEFIAGSVNTNPVVIRRILGLLQKAKLVATKTGKNGGAYLIQSPERITLLDVYQVVEEGSLFALHVNPPNPQCPCGRHLQTVLRDVFSEAEMAMKEVLANVTIAQVVQDIKDMSDK